MYLKFGLDCCAECELAPGGDKTRSESGGGPSQSSLVSGRFVRIGNNKKFLPFLLGSCSAEHKSDN